MMQESDVIDNYLNNVKKSSFLCKLYSLSLELRKINFSQQKKSSFTNKNYVINIQGDITSKLTYNITDCFCFSGYILIDRRLLL